MGVKSCIVRALTMHHLLMSLALTSHVDKFIEKSYPAQENQDGMSLFFTSNPKEMINVPVYFTKAVPSWLKGTLVRNGPGKFENGDRTFQHVFDGFAKLASWQFHGNGSVVFSTRFINSHFYKESITSNTVAPYLLFETVSPPVNLFERVKSLIRGIDNMNINFYEFRNPKTLKSRFAALSDYWIFYEISIKTLATRGRRSPYIRSTRKTKQLQSSINSMGYLNFMSSAHPLPEFGTNNYLTYLCSVAIFPWLSDKISLIRINSASQRSVIAQWSTDRVPYMHSFSVTQTKAILLASPLYVNSMCMVAKAEPFSCLDFYPDKPSTLYSVDLKTGTVDAIAISNVFTMHHINAYDISEGNIVMDVSSYQNIDFIKFLQLHILRDPAKRNKMPACVRLKRITIDIARKSAVVVDIDLGPKPSIASQLDMPVINEAYRSLHYCYVYGIVIKADSVTFSKQALVKKDLCNNGTGDKVWMVPGQYPVEPWFVARPNAIDEDDGILMVPVLRGFKRSTYLIMLDAKDLRQINEAKVPTHIPFSLHGRFFPSNPSHNLTPDTEK